MILPPWRPMFQDTCDVTYPFNQVLRLRTHEPGHRHLPARNPPLRHDRCILKRRLAHEKLVRQHAQTPQVDLLVVEIVVPARLDHLRWQVIQRPAHGLSPVIWRVD